MRSIRIPPPEDEKLVAPELMLPAQLCVRSDAPAHGERHLIMALLEQAVGCYRKHAFPTNRRDQRLFDETEDWFMGDTADPAFSCQDVCDYLGLDVRYVRDALARWRAQEERLRRQPAAA